MAVAIPELLELLGSVLAEVRGLSFLSRVMRAYSFFKDVSKVRKLENAILDYKDIKELTLKGKKVKDYVLNQLFQLNLKSNNFIFFSEEDLLTFIKSRDSNAKILKLADFGNVSLYLVEGTLFSNKWTGLLNYFTFALLLSQFNDFNNNVLNEILGTYNDLYDELVKLRNDIINKLKQEKQEDINNTYCMHCSCCCSCSCEEGSCSCCCSCTCNLVHYVQAWNNLESYIYNRFADYGEYLKNRMLEDEQNSLKAKFILLFDLLMKFLFLRVKEKYLFAVVNQKYILEEIRKERKKSGVMKEIYNYLKKKKGIFDYNELLYRDLKSYLRLKLNKNYSNNQIRALFWTVKKRYMEDKIRVFKKGKKKYIAIN